MIVNPFNFETPANRWEFTDREELLPRIQRLMLERGRRVLLHGRRRMGKTSVMHEAARAGKAVWLFVDLSTASDLNEVAKKLLYQMPGPRRKSLGKVLELLAKYVKISFNAGKFVVGELRDIKEPNATLEEVLNFIDERAQLDDICVTIGIDEFQEIRTLGGERAEWRLRGFIQRHKAVSYIFSGSDHRLLKWMTESKAAFYKQLEVVSVGAIDPALLAQWVDERAKRGGLRIHDFGAEVVAAAGPCTGDVVRLAKAVFQLLAEGKPRTRVVALALDQISLADLHEEFVERWRDLSLPQRAMLRAVAARKTPLLSAETLRFYGIRSTSTASTALQTLVDREILVREDKEIVFDSPFLRRWVEANAAPV